MDSSTADASSARPCCKVGEFLLEIFLALAQLGDLLVDQFLGLVRLGVARGDFLLRDFGLFHQNDFRVLDLEDDFLGHLDLVGERLVFLVLARLQLLVGVFLDLRFLGLNFQVALLAFGFDLLDAIFGGVELDLGGGGPAAQGFAFRPDLGEFLLHAVNFAVAIL